MRKTILGIAMLCLILCTGTEVKAAELGSDGSYNEQCYTDVCEFWTKCNLKVYYEPSESSRIINSVSVGNAINGALLGDWVYVMDYDGFK